MILRKAARSLRCGPTTGPTESLSKWPRARQRPPSSASGSDGPYDPLAARGQRRQGVSDATVDILSRQLQRQVANVAWPKHDAASEPAKIVAQILELAAASHDDTEPAAARRPARSGV